MVQEDIGWAGSWEPAVVKPDTLQELRDLAGAVQFSEGRGRKVPMIWCSVNLQTGEIRYPASRAG